LARRRIWRAECLPPPPGAKKNTPPLPAGAPPPTIFFVGRLPPSSPTPPPRSAMSRAGPRAPLPLGGARAPPPPPPPPPPPAAPDIPTVAEAALPGFEAATWFALAAPAATPRDIVMRLNIDVQRAFAQADTRQRFAEIGMTVADSTPEGVDALIRAEIAKWS